MDQLNKWLTLVANLGVVAGMPGFSPSDDAFIDDAVKQLLAYSG